MTDSTVDTNSTPQGDGNNLQRAIERDYELGFSSVISEAWARVKGNKRTLWISIAIYGALLLGASLVCGLVFGFSDGGMSELSQQLVNLALLPIMVGIQFVGTALASDKGARSGSVLSWYAATLKVILTYILMIVLIVIGTFLLVLPGIYLAVAYQLALPLVVDKNLGPWEALEASRKIVTKKWFTFFGLNLVAGIAIAVSMLLLGIPLIWVLPAVTLGMGIVYRNAVGIEESTLQQVAGN